MTGANANTKEGDTPVLARKQRADDLPVNNIGNPNTWDPAIHIHTPMQLILQESHLLASREK